MPTYINTVQYLYKKNNFQNQQKLHAEYLRECINHYGIPVTYFKNDQNFFKSLSGDAYVVNRTYGENPYGQYTLSANMNLFMSMQTDNPYLRKFGMETVTNTEIAFMRDDFEEQFRDIVGFPETDSFSILVSGNIVSLSGIAMGDVVNDELSGYVSGSVVLPSSGYSTSTVGYSFIRYPRRYFDLLYRSGAYTERVVAGQLSGTLYSYADVDGAGIVSGILTGDLSYRQTNMKNSGPNWGIAPVVGDFIRMREFDSDLENYEEYEITDVQDKSLVPSSEGLNHLLRRYIWKCTVVRRDPSNENVTASDIAQEKFTPDPVVQNEWHEEISNNIFDYDTEVPDPTYDNELGMDSVYGKYGASTPTSGEI